MFFYFIFQVICPNPEPDRPDEGPAVGPEAQLRNRNLVFFRFNKKKLVSGGGIDLNIFEIILRKVNGIIILEWKPPKGSPVARQKIKKSCQNRNLLFFNAKIAPKKWNEKKVSKTKNTDTRVICSGLW